MEYTGCPKTFAKIEVTTKSIVRESSSFSSVYHKTSQIQVENPNNPAKNVKGKTEREHDFLKMDI
jgi:hypothetical protein